ncbi:serine hydrolase domain-containing protein [Enterococcus ratti]|uniref:serine hydrolase domain-containing protein n=1 Tax=Enterococcus ratti TaxID=150033 RepID=UPI00351605AA
MKKGKHAKKRTHSFFTFSLLLLSISLISTSIILWQYQPETSDKNKSSQTIVKKHLKLSPDEKKIAEKIHQLLKKNDYIGSIYVKKNNRTILECGYGYANEQIKKPNDPSLYYQIGSIQKAMTALLILKQIALGRLSLDTKLAVFYPQIPSSQFISIKDLLYMKSGLKRTATPNIPLTDEQVIQFSIKHLKLIDYHTYHYEPVNFTLLAGILVQLTRQSYETLLKNELIRPLGLKHTNFYAQVKHSVDHACSYKMSAYNNYCKTLTESPTTIRNELGTGNISMSVYDLNTFFTKVLAGKFLPKKLLCSLWKESSQNHPYRGGVYCGNNYVLAQGNINRFHCAAAFKRDLKDAVVMESNIQADKKIKRTVTDLRNQIYNLIEDSAIL